MNIIVLVKPTPDITKVRFDVKKGTVDRSSAELEINPFDLYAIEVAVKIKEILGGRITAISMAPPHGERALRDSIARVVSAALRYIHNSYPNQYLEKLLLLPQSPSPDLNNIELTHNNIQDYIGHILQISQVSLLFSVI